MEQTLKGNIELIEEQIEKAIEFAQRKKNSVNLICVSKSVDVKTTQQVINLGMTQLAENRVENLLEKKALLECETPITWHFIGNLQRRKVKKIINEIDYFHALDSLKLAEEINKRAEKVINCFVQVNVSGEQSKQGLSSCELLPFIESLESLDKLRIVGLMTMAPLKSSKQDLHHIFEQLSELKKMVEKKKLSFAPCKELSMGMSSDYQIAIEEGSTFVRVGSSFFRNDYKGVEEE